MSAGKLSVSTQRIFSLSIVSICFLHAATLGSNSKIHEGTVDAYSVQPISPASGLSVFSGEISASRHFEQSLHVLVCYVTFSGNTKVLAQWLTEGLSRVPGISVDIEPLLEDSRVGYRKFLNLSSYAALAVGSPVYLGNPHWRALQWIEDNLGPHWWNRTLDGIPAAVFVSSGGLYQGHEHTLSSLTRGLESFGMQVVRPNQATTGFSSAEGASLLSDLLKTLPETLAEDLRQQFRSAAIELGVRLGRAAIGRVKSAR